MLAALEEQPAEPAEERPANPLESLAGGVFVGRERELERLREAVDAALGGRGCLQLLVGEPGIGKTRTAEELATYARVSGARVLLGPLPRGRGRARVLALGAGDPRLRPRRRPGRARLAAGRGGRRRSPSSSPRSPRSSTSSRPGRSDSEEARFRLFDSVDQPAARGRRATARSCSCSTTCTGPTSPRCCCSSSPRASSASSGLLIVGTYRDVELGRHHPLARDARRAVGDRGQRPHPAARPLGRRGRALHRDDRRRPRPRPAWPRRSTSRPTATRSSSARWSGCSPARASSTAGGSAAELEIPQGVREVVGRRLDRSQRGGQRGARGSPP